MQEKVLIHSVDGEQLETPLDCGYVEYRLHAWYAYPKGRYWTGPSKIPFSVRCESKSQAIRITKEMAW